MVFFFEPRGFVPGKEDYLIYMGKDKFENEELIRYGLPSDVWFHVDNLSSAHVYLRLPNGQGFDDISRETLEDCCQLVKANSIQGHKETNVDIVYTPWDNLKKTSSMEVGQVGFKDAKRVRKTNVPKRQNEIINRLNRTRREEYPDLAEAREAFDRGERAKNKAEVQSQRREEKAARESKKREEELRTYKHIMTEENMVSSKELAEKYKSVQEYEDDFM